MQTNPPSALEPSKNGWLLAIQVPGRDNPSLHPIKGGDADGLPTKLDINVEILPHALIAWCRGERHVCSMVVIPARISRRIIRKAREYVKYWRGVTFGGGVLYVSSISKWFREDFEMRTHR